MCEKGISPLNQKFEYFYGSTVYQALPTVKISCPKTQPSDLMQGCSQEAEAHCPASKVVVQQ